LSPAAAQCRSLCRSFRFWALLLWGAFFACMVWFAVTAVVADNMSYRGSGATLKRADDLFPWHRVIQQRAEPNGR
jgi:hypothetical protein